MHGLSLAKYSRIPALVSLVMLGACSGSNTVPVAITPGSPSAAVDVVSATSSVPNSTLIVNTLADENDGTPNSTCSLREAILTANSGTPTGGCGADNPRIIFEPTLSGTITLGSPLPALNSVNLAGNGSITIDGDGSSSVLEIPGNQQVVLSHLTIAGGTAVNGGGINNQGQLNLTGVTLENNPATALGGGIYNLGGRVVLRDSFILNNTAAEGGGIYNDGGQVSLTNTLVDNNTATDGGGIKTEGGRVTTLGSTVISNNTADFGGGVSLINRGQVSLGSGTQVDSNQATGTGGALFPDETSQIRPLNIPEMGDGIVGGVDFTNNSPNNLPATITVPESLSGTLANTDLRNPTRRPLRFKDDFLLTGFTPGEAVQISLIGSFDTFLQIVDRDTGAVISADDDGGPGNNSQLILQTQPGINYVVRVTSFDPLETGNYTLTTVDLGTILGVRLVFGGNDFESPITRVLSVPAADFNQLLFDGGGSITLKLAPSGEVNNDPDLLEFAEVTVDYADIAPAFLGRQTETLFAPNVLEFPFSGPPATSDVDIIITVFGDFEALFEFIVIAGDD